MFALDHTDEKNRYRKRQNTCLLMHVNVRNFRCYLTVFTRFEDTCNTM